MQLIIYSKQGTALFHLDFSARNRLWRELVDVIFRHYTRKPANYLKGQEAWCQDMGTALEAAYWERRGRAPPEAKTPGRP